MFWFTQGLCFLPAFLVIWSSSTFIVAYIIALFRRDVDIIFPYISDTGAYPPESCIFGLMTFISACAGIATIYARYKFVEKLSGDTRVVSPRLNYTALVFGLLSCLGMCIVATFQETVVTWVHDIGALMFFVPARLFIAILAALAFFPTAICAYFVKQTTLHREKDDEDYPYHVASASCEWVCAFSFICFFLTYIDDFKLFTLRVKTEDVE
ncbi:DNA damage-regulated autophagy modulator protein 1 [Dissostichus eleginoides]|uniref:DNA damage-regulated autophagy modulator protein 1 n=1 Tax=Dissostichus eleginoides TaxID=100907 RepID=A0AAD9FKJ2_DISEL|nr:DNA damage-regulated autophagy modulator protein 1 [Dissostichus eleginoides]